MTLLPKSIIYSAALLLASQAAGQQVIPPPGPPQPAGYYLEFSDGRTMAGGMVGEPAASGTGGATTAVSAPVPTAVVPSVAPSLRHPAPAPLPTLGSAGYRNSSALWEGSCDAMIDAGCDEGCEVPCASDCGFWTHCTSVRGSAVYLRARNADVAYAVPMNGPVTEEFFSNPVQIGGVGVVDPDYELGYQVNVNWAVTCMTSLYAGVLMLDTSTSNQVVTDAPNVVRSLVSHPATSSAATDFLAASANLGLQLDTVDAGLRHLFVGGPMYGVNFLAGARYSRLEQTFGSILTDNGTEQVATNIDFDGAGLSLGLEAERQSCHSNLYVYTRGAASFLAGKFQARYFQGQSFDPNVVDTSWEAGRIVPVLDLELGAGWCSPGGCLRLNAGYLVSAWFNTVQTDEFIRAVQMNDFVNLGDGLTFDGLRAEAQWRF